MFIKTKYDTVSQVNRLLSEWIDNYKKLDFYRWAIIEKERGENIGQIAFCRVYSDCKTAEIEYCIGEPFWGNSYAVEAYHRFENVVPHGEVKYVIV